MKRPLVAYCVLAYALSWAWWLPILLRGDVVRAGDPWPTHVPGLAGPAVAAVVVTAAVDRGAGLRDLGSRLTRWRVGAGWWWVVLGTAALALLGIVVAAVTGEPIPGADEFARYGGVGHIGLVGVVLVVFLANGIGEETGWRGFAADRLLRDHSLTSTSFRVAAIWAGWHLPLFWISASFRSLGPLVVGWAVGLVAASVVLTFMYQHGRRSILLVAAWHTAYNFTSATEATGHVVAVLTTALVIVAAVSILRHERAAATSA
ncbi:CPBP family intramembrane glutamic endopeptidase [Nocardioides mesophilus]|uniref:CPBP family intramembrane metalloprotease n=1 Tax=Nocardioides mesophilus TaxID=433659 RepID=A0A7G9R6F5_9ACTN|nr:CPBP family intramembrane glutamic endopeptidase [Nocardioides mesophilus]QNN51180.1 CPBP family intramembrane metalloprotease [Nocardioides mesophilus]